LDGSFNGPHFTSEVILWALRWHVTFPISDRDRASMRSDRGITVDHPTLISTAQARQ
jgi:transposase, IS6 family